MVELNYQHFQTLRGYQGQFGSPKMPCLHCQPFASPLVDRKDEISEILQTTIAISSELTDAMEFDLVKNWALARGVYEMSL